MKAKLQMPGIFRYSLKFKMVCGDGGGGFFLACENFGRMFDNSFSTYDFFLLLLFFKVEISLRKLIPLCQDQSTMAQRAETTVTEGSLTSCV